MDINDVKGLVGTDKKVIIRSSVLGVPNAIRSYVLKDEILHTPLDSNIQVFDDNANKVKIIFDNMKRSYADTYGAKLMAPYTVCKKLISLIKSGKHKVSLSDTSEITAAFVPKIDWERGTFKVSHDGMNGDLDESHSCFWSQKPGARKMLEKAENGFAIKFYFNNMPYARVLAAFIDKGFVIFNCYSDVIVPMANDPLSFYGKGLAHAFGMSSKEVELVNNGKWGGYFWINRGRAIFIYDPNVVEPQQSYDLRWKDHDLFCKGCGNPANDDDTIDALGYVWCDPCAQKGLFLCTFDKKLYPKKYAVTGPNEKKYYRENIARVEEFIFSKLENIYIMKDTSVFLGKRYGYVSNKSRYELCPQCNHLKYKNIDCQCMSSKPNDTKKFCLPEDAALILSMLTGN